MSNNSFKTWSKTSALLALAGLVGSANAAKIEASDAQPAAAWAVSVDATANLVGSNPGYINANDGASDNWNGYLDKPLLAIKVTSPNGIITFEGVFDLEVLALRHTNMNDESEKGISLDGSPARHIIQELTAKYAATENLYIKAGLGTVNFMERERNLFATRPLQSNAEIRERLFAEVGYTLDKTGTTVVVSIFDGTEQRAVDVLGDFSTDDFVNIPGWDDRADNSASFAGRIVQKLGETGLEASIGFAQINNYDNAGSDQQRVSLGLKGTYEIADWTVSGLIQFVKTFDQVDLSSTVAEVAATRGKFTAYLRGELAEVSGDSGVEDVKRGTVGLQYTLIDHKNVKLTPFAELLVEDRDSYEEINLGLVLGMKMGFGASTGMADKSE